jgi:hypothetical protein
MEIKACVVYNKDKLNKVLVGIYLGSGPQRLLLTLCPTPRVVKIFKCIEGSRSSMMDVENEHNHMRAAFGLRYRFGQPGTPARE